MNFLSLFTFYLSILMPAVAAENADTLCIDDSVALVLDSAIADIDVRENEFQEDISDLYNAAYTEIDTSGWCTSKINAGRFDYRSMLDTLKIVLVDSSRARYYAHPTKNCITSQFGPRRAFWHYGTDLRVKRGDTIQCAFDGIVRVIQFDRYGYGKVVVVRHHDGLETIYGHLSKTTFIPNEQIKAGDAIGLGGNTGRSTGSHLHFEIRYRGEPINPENIIDFETFALRSDTLVLSHGDFAYLTEIRKTVYHRIRKGDFLGKIARRYGTSVRKLCRLNQITPKTILRPGRKIIVRKDTTPAPEKLVSLKSPETPDEKQSSEIADIR